MRQRRGDRVTGGENVTLCSESGYGDGRLLAGPVMELAFPIGREIHRHDRGVGVPRLSRDESVVMSGVGAASMVGPDGRAGGRRPCEVDS